MKDLFLSAYELNCADPQRLFSLAESEGVELRGAVTCGDKVTLSVPFLSVGSFERLLGRMDIEYELRRECFLFRLARVIKRRAGLLVGAVICSAAMLVARRFVINIRVLTDSPEIRSGVMNVLAEQGVGVGSYIPSLRCAELERSMKQRVEGISWAGISKTDGTLIIDVIENVDRPEARRTRLPSDLVAKHDGTIEDIELYDGLLKLPLGSGVTKGETVVSGRIPITKTTVRDGEPVAEHTERYVRSIGTAYGTYTMQQTFEQPYLERSIVMTGERDDRRLLRLLGMDIPLYIDDGGMYREQASYSPLVIFDRELPVGVTTLRREGFAFRTVSYTREQAKSRSEQLMEKYESNFLSEDRVISRETEVEYGENSVKMTAKYVIYGVMTEEKEFFIKKS